MKAKALATFMMKQNLVRAGDVFESDEEHIRALARNRLAAPVEETESDDEDDPEPLETKPLPVAVETKPAPAAGKGKGKGKGKTK